MKKIFLGIVVCTLALNSCKKDNDDEIEVVSIETQNTYDDEAADKFLQDHYLDAKGNIKAFDSNDESDDQFTKLANMNPVKLPSGVRYIIRPGAQPDSGRVFGPKDILYLMSSSTSYVASKKDDVVSFGSASTFRNTITGTGVPEKDPAYYYIKSSVLANATTDAAKQRSYYEIEGFQEAIHHFESFNMEPSADYNLQGVIIVPSRAAFARDSHFNYTGLSYKDRSFIFNFQIYKSEVRPENQD